MTGRARDGLRCARQGDFVALRASLHHGSVAENEACSHSVGLSARKESIPAEYRSLATFVTVNQMKIYLHVGITGYAGEVNEVLQSVRSRNSLQQH